MNPIKFILKSKLQRGWKIVVFSLILAAFVGLSLMFLATYLPEGGLQIGLGLLAIFVVVVGLVSMIGGFLIVLYDLYKS